MGVPEHLWDGILRRSCATSPVARRVAALCLALGLLISALPLAVLAQDPEPPLFEDAFDISGHPGLEDAVCR